MSAIVTKLREEVKLDVEDLPFKFVGAFDHEDDGEVPQSLIEGLLPAEGVVGVFGSERSFKSFFCIDICFHVALGRPWFGRAVTQGAVFYIAAEDSQGHRKRRTGWRVAHGVGRDEQVPLFVLEEAPNLGEKDGDADGIIASIKASGLAPRLIVIDTLIETLDGADENTKGMALFMRNAKRIADQLGAVVIAVHHVGHRNKRRAVGGSTFGRNAHNTLLLERQRGPAETTFLDLRKVKNGPEGVEGLMVTLKEVELPHPFLDHGKPMTTLVIESAVEAPRPRQDKDGKAKSAPSEETSGHPADEDAEPDTMTDQDYALDELQAAIDAHGAEDGSVSESVWNDRLKELFADKTPAAIRKAMSRAKKDLEAECLIKRAEGKVWLVTENVT
jgi:AAA domain